MDSNSTLVRNPHSSLWKGERCCAKGDHLLWLLMTTIIRNQIIALHTRLSRGHGCELIHGLQHFRSTRKNTVPYLPACKKGIYFTTAYLYRMRSHDRGIPARPVDR